MSDSAQGPGRVFLSDSLGDTLAPVRKQDATTQNLRLEPVVAVPVRRLSAEPPQPERRVLAQVLEHGYQQRIIGRASDLPATLVWLEERGAKRQG